MTTTRAESRFLTTDDIATDLQDTRDSVLKRIHAGELPATNIGTPRRPRYRIRRADYERWLTTRTYTN